MKVLHGNQADTLTSEIWLHPGSDLNSWTGLFAKLLVTRRWDSARRKILFGVAVRPGVIRIKKFLHVGPVANEGLYIR